jgi:hypothetical protein
MMLKIYLFLFCLSFSNFAATAQQKLIDSLQKRLSLTAPTNENYILYEAQLAEAVRFTDTAKSKALIAKSLALCAGHNNGIVKTKVYCIATIIYRQNNEYAKMIAAADNAINFARASKDDYASGYANYCKSLSMESLEDESELAFYFTALKYAEKVNDAILLSKIYYGIYGFYAIHNNIELENKYATLCLQEALKTTDGEVLSKAWQASGTNFSDQYNKTQNKTLLDAALHSFRNGIEAFQQQQPYIIPQMQYGVLALNTAVNYYQNFMPAKKDSVYFYVHKALESALVTADADVEANCYGLLSELAYQNNDYASVENLLSKALVNAVNTKTEQPVLLSKIYYGLAELYRKKNDFKLAFSYQEKYVEAYNKSIVFEQQKNNQLLDAKFDFRKKNEQIQLLNEKNILSARQKYFLAGIAVLLLLSLLFMFRSYHFRLNLSIQEQNLLLAKAQELKLETELLEEKAKLKTEEAARLQIEKKLIEAQKTQMQNELVAGNLQVEHKNEVLQNLKEKLFSEDINDKTIHHLARIINQEIRLDKDFDTIKNNFKDIQPEFIEKLQMQGNQKLTALDLKYCSYVKLNLSSKQMATLLNVEPTSIRMSKYRLKQKLNLNKEDDLYAFLYAL